MADFYRRFPSFGGGDTIWTGNSPASVLLREEFFGPIGPPAPWTPAQIFSSGEVGFWGDVTPAQLWQDLARTIPVTAPFQAVASYEVNTASGVIYFETPDPAQRPIYRTDSGVGYLLFDGVNDYMKTAGSIAPTSRNYQAFAAVRPTSLSGVRNIIDGDAGSVREAQYIRINAGDAEAIVFSGGNPNFDTGPSVTNNADTVLTAISISQTSLDIRVDGVSNGATGTVNVFNNDAHFVEIGRSGFENNYFEGRVYGVILRRGPNLSSTEITNANAWMAGLYAVGGGTDTLSANNLITGSPVVGNPSLTQANSLSTAGVVTGSPVLGTSTLNQRHTLSGVNLLTGTPNVNTSTLNQTHLLSSTGIVTGSVVVGNPSLQGPTELTANSIVTGGVTLGTPTLGQIVVLSATGIVTGSPVVNTSTIGQVQQLIANNLNTGGVVVVASTLTQVHQLLSSNLVTGSPVLGTSTLPPSDFLTAENIAAGPVVLGSPGLSEIVVLSAEGLVSENVFTGNSKLYQYNLVDLQNNYDRLRAIILDKLSQDSRVSSQLAESRVVIVLDENRIIRL